MDNNLIVFWIFCRFVMEVCLGENIWLEIKKKGGGIYWIKIRNLIIYIFFLIYVFFKV